MLAFTVWLFESELESRGRDTCCSGMRTPIRSFPRRAMQAAMAVSVFTMGSLRRVAHRSLDCFDGATCATRGCTRPARTLSIPRPPPLLAERRVGEYDCGRCGSATVNRAGTISASGSMLRIVHGFSLLRRRTSSAIRSSTATAATSGRQASSGNQLVLPAPRRGGGHVL